MRTLTAKAPTVARPLTLDDRLALTSLAMDSALNVAGVRFDVTAAPIAIPETPVDPQPAAVQPTAPTAVLREAGRLIGERGWCRRWLTTGTAICARRAIEVAAGGEGALADAAEAVLWAAIQREQPGAYLSVPDWNDRQTGAASVMRMLNRAG